MLLHSSIAHTTELTATALLRCTPQPVTRLDGRVTHQGCLAVQHGHKFTVGSVSQGCTPRPLIRLLRWLHPAGGSGCIAGACSAAWLLCWRCILAIIAAVRAAADVPQVLLVGRGGGPASLKQRLRGSSRRSRQLSAHTDRAAAQARQTRGTLAGGNPQTQTCSCCAGPSRCCTNAHTGRAIPLPPAPRRAHLCSSHHEA